MVHILARVGHIDRSRLSEKVIMDGDRLFDGRYLEISATSCPESATLGREWPPIYGSGPFALATPCSDLPGRYSGPSKITSRVADPWSWDVGSSTSAAQTSLNMVIDPEIGRRVDELAAPGGPLHGIYRYRTGDSQDPHLGTGDTAGGHRGHPSARGAWGHRQRGAEAA